jgi:stage II sporulation protein D
MTMTNTKMMQEPKISVGIVENVPQAQGTFNGRFELPTTVRLEGSFSVRYIDGRLVVFDDEGVEVMKGTDIHCTSINGATFTLNGVTIGINFHWERQEDQTFAGDVRFVMTPEGSLTVINEIGVEDYLKSVISSEMSAEAPMELLRAHAITSRSWLLAMLNKQAQAKNIGVPPVRSTETDSEIVRWYDREDHSLFNVCADDHCQRYQGISKIISENARKAVEDTRGQLLIHQNQVCDARFYKACGGLTENFENTWEDVAVPYLRTVSDAPQEYSGKAAEPDAREWILSNPEAYCNTNDVAILKQILPSFDQETTDFFRWRVDYEREELERIVLKRSGIDFGTITALVPLQRGSSARITRLKIVGTKRTIIVGKELEIRRWLSRSHLYSSAFVVDAERDVNGTPIRFTLYGAGWGHGVGLCQIGAAVMAAKGKKAEEIVLHYFPGASLQKLY